jgi:hypothetical protein
MTYIVDGLIDDLRDILPQSTKTAIYFEDSSTVRVDMLLRYIHSHPRHVALIRCFQTSLWKRRDEVGYLLRNKPDLVGDRGPDNFSSGMSPN